MGGGCALSPSSSDSLSRPLPMPQRRSWSLVFPMQTGKLTMCPVAQLDKCLHSKIS